METKDSQLLQQLAVRCEQDFNTSFQDILSNTELEELFKMTDKYYADFDARASEFMLDTQIRDCEEIGTLSVNSLVLLLVVATVWGKGAKKKTLGRKHMFTLPWLKIRKGEAFCVVNSQNDTSTFFFVTDKKDPQLQKPILQCIYHLKEFTEDKGIPFAYGVCSNVKTFRFVEYCSLTKKLSLSEPIDIFDKYGDCGEVDKMKLKYRQALIRIKAVAENPRNKAQEKDKSMEIEN